VCVEREREREREREMLFICSHNIETMECAVVASSELLTQASGCFILNKHQMVLFLTLTKL